MVHFSREVGYDAIKLYLWNVSERRAMNRLSMRMAERASHAPTRM